MRDLQPPQELLGVTAKRQKLVPHRLQPVAQGLCPMDPGAVQLDLCSGRYPFMTDDELEFR